MRIYYAFVLIYLQVFSFLVLFHYYFVLWLFHYFLEFFFLIFCSELLLLKLFLFPLDDETELFWLFELEELLEELSLESLSLSLLLSLLLFLSLFILLFDKVLTYSSVPFFSILIPNPSNKLKFLFLKTLGFCLFLF